MARIYEIQGAGRASPLVGQHVSTTGIVTAKADRGFYLQDSQGDGRDATSDAIFVFTAKPPDGVNVGDELKVSGNVTEFVPREAVGHLSTTQLTRASWEIVSRGNRLPKPVRIGPNGRLPPSNDVGAAIDFYASLEGMRVELTRSTTVLPTAGRPSFAVLPDGVAVKQRTRRGGIALDPNSSFTARLPVRFTGGKELAVGDVVTNLVGVMRYQFGNFQLLATDPFAAANAPRLAPDVTKLVSDDKSMTIGWFNVENFDPLDAEKAARLAKQIVENLRAPDVLGLGEVQDNDGVQLSNVVAANQSYKALIEAIVAAGGPSYEWVDIPPQNGADGGQPGGNIRCGYLYRTDRAKLDPASVRRIGEAHGAFTDSRKSLVATFVKNGVPVTVIANHFASKRGSTPLYGSGPQINGGEEQRSAQAEVVRREVEALLKKTPGAKVPVVGDFNELEHNAPIRRLEGDTLVNLMKRVPAAERYTYNFEGISQAIDHGFVPKHMADSSELDVVHINTDFAERSSDHDAFVMRVAL
jgi:predicted extracellular nuclease